MSTKAILRTEGLTKTYVAGTVETPALRGVDFELHQGEFTAIAGPSGSGKSTLLHLLGGLDRPTSGEIYLDGTALSALSRDALSRLRLERIGFVFQAYNLIPVLTVLENAAFILELQGVARTERIERGRRVLAELGIEKYADTFPNRISGGEQQRVAVARAVVSEPSIVLADEPTANLDTAMSLELIDLMRRLNSERSATFLFATHDGRLLDRVNRLVTLVDGCIAGDEVRNAA
ncbi:MAG: ABC transporter ATP-binding protein [Candidatus Bipolaricaulis sp.]|nr:ABC transporter ATP-binding protein [Candidatus Bipolaricaulis sp.]MDD5646193.1 ABC transporter ATP-binding protein [Candidatus Bipolaricaulis sp.]